MIYLDHGATSFHKPPQVKAAVVRALEQCANPGRGGHEASIRASRIVYRTRELAAERFGCMPEQVVFTANCTHGLNMALHTLVRPGDRVVISGFEHNAVVRPLHLLGAKITVAGRKLFDQDHTLECFEKALKQGAEAAVFTHVSNVFGYILPVAELAALCRRYGVPFTVDCAQSAGCLPVDLRGWGADFVAMPGHKGLLGPQGTGILLCGRDPKPLLAGGTGSDSRSYAMPDHLPDRLEAGTLNVPGIAGLGAGLQYLKEKGVEAIFRREQREARRCAEGLQKLGKQVFFGKSQGGTVSFVPNGDPEEVAEKLAKRGIALRAGLHCAPLAHESAGTLETGTVRVSFGHDAAPYQTEALLRAVKDVDVM